MAIFESTLYPATANESPVVTPTFCHTARPSSSSSALSVASITPCLTASSDSNSFASFEQIVPAGGFFYTASMNQLDASGYPTRALYYLHKRMLEVVLYPGQYHNQSWCLQIRPGTPIPSPPLSDEDEGMIAPENSLEDDEILNILGAIKQARLMEDDPVLHNLCPRLFPPNMLPLRRLLRGQLPAARLPNLRLLFLRRTMNMRAVLLGWLCPAV
ncbi:hypothetical protein RSOL_435010 [Rhizoctonia solani AG-3 Rhs1AP]|uniref:Uncharacterized protein n=1 Tax=Rhizoctonia solani AG-3 Rhs1AP TaxID=1086054 RepID=X8JLK0_9AGAM|nr:hypothetical protein RSOL_435010 [Rhizoctonia solani AG-3 Rhs1AP]